MYTETEQQGFAGFELLIMAFGHGLRGAKVAVQIDDCHPWEMTIEEACRGCVMSAMEGKTERAKAYLAPVIRRLAPASHGLVKSIEKLAKYYKKEKEELKNETSSCRDGDSFGRLCSSAQGSEAFCR